MSKLLILNSSGSEKYSIISLKNIEHYEKKMGKPIIDNSISEEEASIQNLGVCCVYASETLGYTSEMTMFIEICFRSIAKCKETTDLISQREIAEKTKLSIRTVRKYLKKLEKDGFLKINKSKHKTIGIGSSSSSYTPIFKQ